MACFSACILSSFFLRSLRRPAGCAALRTCAHAARFAALQTTWEPGSFSVHAYLTYTACHTHTCLTHGGGVFSPLFQEGLHCWRDLPPLGPSVLPAAISPPWTIGWDLDGDACRRTARRLPARARLFCGAAEKRQATRFFLLGMRTRCLGIRAWVLHIRFCCAAAMPYALRCCRHNPSGCSWLVRPRLLAAAAGRKAGRRTPLTFLPYAGSTSFLPWLSITWEDRLFCCAYIPPQIMPCAFSCLYFWVCLHFSLLLPTLPALPCTFSLFRHHPLPACRRLPDSGGLVLPWEVGGGVLPAYSLPVYLPAVYCQEVTPLPATHDMFTYLGPGTQPPGMRACLHAFPCWEGGAWCLLLPLWDLFFTRRMPGLPYWQAVPVFCTLLPFYHHAPVLCLWLSPTLLPCTPTYLSPCSLSTIHSCPTA